MFKIRSGKMHRRLLLSYIIVFLLPLLYFGIYFFTMFNSTLKEEAINKNSSALQKAVNLVDTPIQNLRQISLQLSLDTELKPFHLLDDPYRVLLVQKELKKFTIGNSLITDAYLYFHGDDYLISSRTSASIDAFFAHLYSYENWTPDTFRSDITEIVNTDIRGEEPVLCYGVYAKHMLTFLHPIGNLNATEPHGTLIILVDKVNFLNLLDSTALAEQSVFLMFDQNGQLLLSSGDTPLLKDKEFADLLQTGQSSKQINNGGRQYSIAQKISPVSGIHYISIVPLDILMGPVNRHQLIFFMCICIIIGVAGIIIFYFLNRNYKPIRNLKQFAEQLTLINDQNSLLVQDELKQIQSSLEYLYESNRMLQSQVTSSKYYLQDCLIFNLIRGEFNTVKQFNEIAERVDIRLKGDLYVVAVLYLRCTNNSSISEISRYIEKHDRFSYDFYLHQHFDENKIILVLNPNKTEEKSVVRHLDSLRIYLENQYHITVVIGLGNCYDDIRYISKSFLEADTAVDYRLIYGSSRVITYKECIPAENVTLSLDYADACSIQKFLQSGDYTGLEHVLDMLEQRLADMVVPIFMVKSFCFDIIQEVEKAISGSHLHSTLAQNIDTLKMLEYDTTAQLFHILRLSCKQICDAVKNGILQDNNTKAMQMIHYIEQNSSDPSFSTEKMAEYFSMSSTALCQYFKNHTGQTITDYLVDFRIKVAKNLLKATDYSINQISFNAGYYNVSSFIRRFKQITGYAPGTWRELHRNNAVNNE